MFRGTQFQETLTSSDGIMWERTILSTSWSDLLQYESESEIGLTTQGMVAICVRIYDRRGIKTQKDNKNSPEMNDSEVDLVA